MQKLFGTTDRLHNLECLLDLHVSLFIVLQTYVAMAELRLHHALKFLKANAVRADQWCWAAPVLLEVHFPNHTAVYAVQDQSNLVRVYGLLLTVMPLYAASTLRKRAAILMSCNAADGCELSTLSVADKCASPLICDGVGTAAGIVLSSLQLERHAPQVEVSHVPKW